jgi:hypothetical protein
MVDLVQPAAAPVAPAPATPVAQTPSQAPAVVSTPTPVVQQMNKQTEATVGKQLASGGDPVNAEVASQQRRGGKDGPRSNLIHNPAPVTDPDVPVPDNPVDEDGLPASTRAEMEAGRAALGKNAPNARRDAKA